MIPAAFGSLAQPADLLLDYMIWILPASLMERVLCRVPRVFGGN